jgi:alpha-D-xyloside xylohydrolase
MIMNRLITLLAGVLFTLSLPAKSTPFGKGTMTVRTIAHNAVRITYSENGATSANLPDWLYVHQEETTTDELSVHLNPSLQTLIIQDKQGRTVFTATGHQLEGGEATLTISSPRDEFLYGLGQFQDGYNNIRGVSRRLTQVNTQASVPMMLSSKGYGLLWNNYGLTEFNPASHQVTMTRQEGNSSSEVVNVTSTEGGKQEVRQRNIFSATIDIAKEGDYAILLDVGQKMARRHHLTVDGKTIINMQNTWLPPTASTITHLTAGTHTLTAELSRGDSPVVHYDLVSDQTVFRSPLSSSVDYTVFVGTPDEIIATYRQLTGEAPLMPRWALGYIHCRERFHSQDEILKTAQQFRDKQLPVDVIVQDWQYWGKYGWNSMRFDETHYPNPRQLTDSLHAMDMRLMVSVWSKIDKQSEVGREMNSQGYYIPGTDWIDFFNPSAASAYWKNFSERLVPLGIDAWWQDATEPENDDLVGRRVNAGQWPGEIVRNVYPLLVNKTVYEGLLQTQSSLGKSQPRPMILTRCGFPGIQRYGSALWSGDVGNDWETFRRQLTAGLGIQAAGIPWWTYDAGGFFRPGDQYTNADYIERMLRWIETSVYLPLMRVHGYMSNTEPWNYGAEAEQIIGQSLHERYRLLPYIYSHAAEISTKGSTLMRPLVFDFTDDPEALQQRHEYLFGRSLLISPITEGGVKAWRSYLPRHAAGWYDYHSGAHHAGGQYVTTTVTRSAIPVFVRGGSILPISTDDASSIPSASRENNQMELRIYPGADATFTLYEDNGQDLSYQQGECSRILLQWDDNTQTFTIHRREGSYPEMSKRRTFTIHVMGGPQKTIVYKGKEKRIKMK